MMIKRYGVLGVFFGSVWLLAVACASWKETARTVVDVSIATCVAEHPEITDETEMRTVCKYVEAFGPIVRDLLSARKRGLARVAAHRDDAGAADAGK